MYDLPENAILYASDRKRTKEEKAELKALQREFIKQQAKADFYEVNKES